MSGKNLMSIGARDQRTGLVQVIVETAAGSRNKYRYDEELGIFRLHKSLPLGARFPFDFGFIPSTRAEDGDPLDIMIVGGEPTFIGCLVTVRLLGILEAEQTEKTKTIRNDRLIGVPETEKIRPEARSFKDLPSVMLDQIEHFFRAYNQAEGRKFTILARRSPRVAERCIDEGMRAHRASQSSRRRG